MFEMNREQILVALEKLATEFQSDGGVTLRLVGGAALALHGFDRGITMDIDAVMFSGDRSAEILLAASRIAEDVSRADALPAIGQQVEWIEFRRFGSITVEIADLRALLAMKLRAGRPGRDTRDIDLLIEACDIDSVGEVIELYGNYYPGDEPSQRTLAFVEEALTFQRDAENRAFDEGMADDGPISERA
jgi:hypothetical protein